MSNVITVGGMRQTKKIETSSPMPMTKVLEAYFEVNTVAEVTRASENMTVRMNNSTVAPEEFASTEVPVGGFVTVYPAQVAQGGVRGA